MAGVPYNPLKAGANLLPQEWERGTLLPIEQGSKGGTRLAIPQALLDLFDAFTLPGDVYQGNVDPMSDEGIGRAAGFVGNLGALGLGSGAATGQALDPDLLNIFAGPRAKTADLDALANAMESWQGEIRHKGGVTAKAGQDIFEQTGWFTGPDGKPRFEIPDVLPSIGAIPDPVHTFSGRVQKAITGKSPEVTSGGPLDWYLDHPELYKAYPELAKLWTEVTSRPGKMEGLNDKDLGLIEAKGETPQDIQSVLLHEAQHGVQGIEDFAGGGSPDWMRHVLAVVAPTAEEQLLYPDPYMMYRALMGETEARNVQDRFKFGIKQGAPFMNTPYSNPYSSFNPKKSTELSAAGMYDLPFQFQVNPKDIGKGATTEQFLNFQNTLKKLKAALE